MNSCSVEELHEMRDRKESLLLLDVRTAEELSIASIDGATHLPLDEISVRLGELEEWRDRDVVCMCHHGMRSAYALQILESAGFTRVRNLTGGIDAWSLRVDPTIRQY